MSARGGASVTIRVCGIFFVLAPHIPIVRGNSQRVVLVLVLVLVPPPNHASNWPSWHCNSSSSVLEDEAGELLLLLERLDFLSWYGAGNWTKWVVVIKMHKGKSLVIKATEHRQNTDFGSLVWQHVVGAVNSTTSIWFPYDKWVPF